MTSRTGALIAPPSWGREAHPQPERAHPAPEASGRTVRWGVRGRAAADVLGGAAILGATVGLWAAVFLAVR